MWIKTQFLKYKSFDAKLLIFKRKVKMKILISKDAEARNFRVHLFLSFEVLCVCYLLLKVPDTSVHVERHFLLQSRFEDESATSHTQYRE